MVISTLKAATRKISLLQHILHLCHCHVPHLLLSILETTVSGFHFVFLTDKIFFRNTATIKKRSCKTATTYNSRKLSSTKPHNSLREIKVRSHEAFYFFWHLWACTLFNKFKLSFLFSEKVVLM